MNRRPPIAATPFIHLALIATGLAASGRADENSTRPVIEKTAVRVGCKDFTESAILAEMVRGLAISAGHDAPPTRRYAGTRLAYEALRAGTIDVYPEYTGTLAAEILGDPALASRDALAEALAPAGLAVGPPLGFSNSYALGMRRDRAAALGIATIGDLIEHPELRLGLSSEFVARAEGWPGLRQTYGLPQKDVTSLVHTLAYQGLARGGFDVVDVFTTDPAIERYDLTVLVDDRRHFPAYEAVLLYRSDLAAKAPDVAAALDRLAGRIDERAMIRLSGAGDARPNDTAVIATTFLREQGFGVDVAVATSLPARIAARTGEHLVLVGLSLAAAIVVCIPLGVLAHRRRAVGQVLLTGMEIVQTVPALALLVMLFALVGSAGDMLRTWTDADGGAGGGRFGLATLAPVLVALFLYSLLPITRNTLVGLDGIPAGLAESATVLGLTGWRRLATIDLPLASPLIVAGVKTVAVINVGYAALGGLIGAGGYGQPIMEGLATSNMARVMEGAVPAAVLAVIVKFLCEGLERLIVPRGLRLRTRT